MGRVSGAGCRGQSGRLQEGVCSRLQVGSDCRREVEEGAGFNRVPQVVEQGVG